jgi:hypothetical protein
MTTEAAGESPVDRGDGRLEPERADGCAQGCNGCDECTNYDDDAWCDRCNNDGRDPWTDYLLPCPK